MQALGTGEESEKLWTVRICQEGRSVGCGGLCVLISVCGGWPWGGEGKETNLLLPFAQAPGPRQFIVILSSNHIFNHFLSPHYCSEAIVKPPQDYEALEWSPCSHPYPPLVHVQQGSHRHPVRTLIGSFLCQTLQDFLYVNCLLPPPHLLTSSSTTVLVAPSAPALKPWHLLSSTARILPTPAPPYPQGCFLTSSCFY